MAKKRKTELDIDIVEEEAPQEEEAPPPEAEAPAEGEKPAEEEEKKEKKPYVPGPIVKILILVVPAILLIGGLGGGAYYYFTSKAKEAELARLKAEEEQRRKEEILKNVPQVPIYSLDRFFVPLKDKDKERFLAITVSFELSSDKVRKELNKFKASIREAIFFYLSGKSLADVSGPEKMKIIEADFKLLINRNLRSGSAKKVFFEEFIVQ